MDAILAIIFGVSCAVWTYRGEWMNAAMTACLAVAHGRLASIERITRC